MIYLIVVTTHKLEANTLVYQEAPALYLLVVGCSRQRSQTQGCIEPSNGSNPGRGGQSLLELLLRLFPLCVCYLHYQRCRCPLKRETSELINYTLHVYEKKPSTLIQVLGYGKTAMAQRSQAISDFTMLASSYYNQSGNSLSLETVTVTQSDG